MLEVVKDSDDLKEFLFFLYGEESGYVYVAVRNQNLEFDHPEYWKQEFFEWPKQKEEIIRWLHKGAESYDTYIAPALFSAPSSKKEHVKGSHVAWVDFDGKIPTDLNGSPSPSVIVASSDPANNKQHWYWRLENFVTDIKLIERLNRGLAYSLGADVSGWDANQVLRPPTTKNYKYGNGQQVSLLSITPYSINPSAFSSLPEPPAISTEFNVSDLQDAALIVASYEWSKQAFNLYRTLAPVDRSAALMQLAYFGAEMGMQDAEIFTILYHADERWKKFRGRPDRIRRLNDIIAVARTKHPYYDGVRERSTLPILGFKEFLNSDIKIDWVVPGFLESSGQLLLTAKPGVGKSRFTLAFFIHLALGKNFLHYEITKPRKLIYYSLEMGHAQLLYFLSHMSQSLSTQELNLLQDNLLLVPLGEALYLDKPAGQKLVEKTLNEYSPDGYCFDSLSRTTPETVNDEGKIKDILDWDAIIRNRYGNFSWYIHHNRKATIGNKRPRTLDDVLGATVIAANTTAAYTLWSTDPQNKTLDVICVKQRLAEVEKIYTLSSTENLMYTERAVIDVDNNSDSASGVLGLGPGTSNENLYGTRDTPNKGSGHPDFGF